MTSCTHVPPDTHPATGHRCVCCNLNVEKWGNYCAPCFPKFEKPERSDFTRHVEPASTGTCFLCSRPDAAFKFHGDDSVRICATCVPDHR